MGVACPKLGDRWRRLSYVRTGSEADLRVVMRVVPFCANSGKSGLLNAELKLRPRKPHSLPVIEGLFRRGTRKRDDAAGSRLLDTGLVMNY